MCRVLGTLFMNDKREIVGVIEAMFAALRAHDAAGIASFLHPDATVWDYVTARLLRGAGEHRKLLEASQAKMKTRGAFTMSLDTPVVDVWGDFAIACYTLVYDYQPPNPSSGTVRITSVLKRQGDSWLIVHHNEGVTPLGVAPMEEP